MIIETRLITRPTPAEQRPIERFAAECRTAPPGALANIVARLRYQVAQSTNPTAAALLAVAAGVARERNVA